MIRTPKKSAPRNPVAADKVLGQRIRDRRKELGISQGDLADKLGVSFQQVQKYENGLNRVTFHRLTLIAKRLDCTPDDLLPTDDRFADASSLFDGLDKDVLRMLRAYNRITDEASQHQLVIMIETIADASER